MPPEAQPNIDLDTGRFASFIHAAATAITNQTTMDQLGRSTFNLQTPIGIVAFPELFPGAARGRRTKGASTPRRIAQRHKMLRVFKNKSTV
jgi:hypothetical protein